MRGRGGNALEDGGWVWREQVGGLGMGMEGADCLKPFFLFLDSGSSETDQLDCVILTLSPRLYSLFLCRVVLLKLDEKDA